MSKITRAEFFESWSSNVRTLKLNSLLEHTAMIFGNDIDHIKSKLHFRKLWYDFEMRWNQSRRDKFRFMTNNESWHQ